MKGIIFSILFQSEQSKKFPIWDYSPLLLRLLVILTTSLHKLVNFLKNIDNTEFADNTIYILFL